MRVKERTNKKKQKEGGKDDKRDIQKKRERTGREKVTTGETKRMSLKERMKKKKESRNK